MTEQNDTSTPTEDKDLSIAQQFNLHKARELLPNKVVRVHGCLGCEWKGGKKDRYGDLLCPHGFKQKTDMVKYGICPRRALYLAMFSKDPKNIKSYTQWQREYNTAIAQQENMKDIVELDRHDQRIQLLEEELIEAKQADDETLIKNIKKELKETRTEQYYARQRWEGLMDKVMKHTDKKLDRESNEKQFDAINSLGIANINKIIAGEFKPVDGMIVDAEFKELMDEDEN